MVEGRFDATAGPHWKVAIARQRLPGAGCNGTATLDAMERLVVEG